METRETNEDGGLKIFGNWGQIAKKMKGLLPDLSDADLELEAGKERELLRKLEYKLRKTEDELIYIIKKCQPEIKSVQSD